MAATLPETPAEIAVKMDFRANIWSVFQELYEDKWDPGACLLLCAQSLPDLDRTERWSVAVGEWSCLVHVPYPNALISWALCADYLLARFKAAHDPAVVQRFWVRAKLPAWDALEAQFRKGPPPFLRPGWKSPMLGKKVDLRWLDTGKFEHVKGNMDGWKTAKLLVIELWASYVPPLAALVVAHGAQSRSLATQWEPGGDTTGSVARCVNC